MPSHAETVAAGDSTLGARPSDSIIVVAPTVEPASSDPTKPGTISSSASVVTPTKPQKTPRRKKRAKAQGERAIAVDSIQFNNRDESIKALRLLRGPNCPVPTTLPDIISTILNVYSVAELKPFWVQQFGDSVAWKSKPSAVPKLVAKVAYFDNNSDIKTSANDANVTTSSPQK